MTDSEALENSGKIAAEMPAPAPQEEIPEIAELTAEEAAALDFLNKDSESDALAESE